MVADAKNTHLETEEPPFCTYGWKKNFIPALLSNYISPDIFYDLNENN